MTYWVGVQQRQSLVLCLFSLGCHPSNDVVTIEIPYRVDDLLHSPALYPSSLVPCCTWKFGVTTPISSWVDFPKVSWYHLLGHVFSVSFTEITVSIGVSWIDNLSLCLYLFFDSVKRPYQKNINQITLNQTAL